MANDRDEGGASLFLAFLLGGFLGACMALLYAPESGKRTRVRIRHLAEDFRERATDTAEEIRDRIEDALDQGKDSVLSAYEAGREAFMREREALLNQKEDASSATT
ncbi:MAG: YtxH domain-containing protein [Candidatus Methylomirabilales bacterium]